jgi:hypothetical protein
MIIRAPSTVFSAGKMTLTPERAGEAAQIRPNIIKDRPARRRGDFRQKWFIINAVSKFYVIVKLKNEYYRFKLLAMANISSEVVMALEFIS